MAAGGSAAGNPERAAQSRAAPFPDPESGSENRAAPFVSPGLGSGDPTPRSPESKPTDRVTRPGLAVGDSAGRSAGAALAVPCEWGYLVVTDRLGSGAFGDVYLAREKALNHRWRSRSTAPDRARTASASGAHPETSWARTT